MRCDAMRCDAPWWYSTQACCKCRSTAHAFPGQSTKLGKAQAHRRRVNALRRKVVEAEIAQASAEEELDAVRDAMLPFTPHPTFCPLHPTTLN